MWSRHCTPPCAADCSWMLHLSESFLFWHIVQIILFSCFTWKITTLPPLSPVASSSPSWLNSTHEIMSASVTSSSRVPFTCEKHHCMSLLPANDNCIIFWSSQGWCAAENYWVKVLCVPFKFVVWGDSPAMLTLSWLTWWCLICKRVQDYCSCTIKAWAASVSSKLSENSGTNGGEREAGAVTSDQSARQERGHSLLQTAASPNTGR